MDKVLREIPGPATVERSGAAFWHIYLHPHVLILDPTAIKQSLGLWSRDEGFGRQGFQGFQPADLQRCLSLSSVPSAWGPCPLHASSRDPPMYNGVAYIRFKAFLCKFEDPPCRNPPRDGRARRGGVLAHLRGQRATRHHPVSFSSSLLSLSLHVLEGP